MPLSAFALALGLCAVLLAGCGSSTETVSVAGPPAITQTTQRSSQTSSPPPQTTTASTTTVTTETTTVAGGGTAAPGTRTASEPAFAEQEVRAEGVSAAEAVLRAHGYTASDPSQYHEDQALRVLIGSRTGDQEQAFFFVDGRYIGTDTKLASGDIQIISQGETEVTLGYALYRPGNALCCPAGGVAKVRFQLNNGQLMALDPIPPANSGEGLSRQ